MKKAVKISLSDFPENDNTIGIKNFIISDRDKFPANFALNQSNILDGVAFFICIRGTAKIRINFRDYEVDPNTVLTILPNHIFEAIEVSDDFFNVMLIFSIDFLSDMPIQLDIVKQIGASPYLKVNNEDKRIFLEIHNLIVRLYEQKQHPLREDIAKSMLYTLILQLKAVMNTQAESDPKTDSNTRQVQLTEQFMKLLSNNFKTNRTPAFYADKLCVSTKYLSQVVRETTNESVFAWLNKATVIGIKNMLRTTDLSIAQISDELNFPNPSFFGRYFKRHTGMTPGEYRKGEVN